MLKLQLVKHVAHLGSKNSSGKPALVEIDWNALKNGIERYLFFRDVFERFHAPHESFFSWMIKPE